MSTVPKDATSVGHLRDGHFVIIVRGTKEPTDAKVTSEAGEKLPQHFLACPATDEEVMAGNVNASRYIQKLAAFVPEVRSYINFRDTGERCSMRVAETFASDPSLAYCNSLGGQSAPDRVGFASATCKPAQQ